MVRLILQVIEENWSESGAWSEYLETMRQVLFLTGDSEVSEDPHSRWLTLPGLCCEAAGGDESTATGVAAAWACLYAAAHALDKVEDNDPFDSSLKGLSEGEVINAANGLVFSAYLILNQLYRQEETQQAAFEICDDFSKCLLAMASGQHRDLFKSEWSIGDWMAIAGGKSGSFFGLACRSGARLGGSNVVRVEAFGKYGHHLGVLLQLRDDITDIRPALVEGKRAVDLNRSLAVAYARDVMPESDKDRLTTAIENLAADAGAARALVELLDKSGAALYLRTEIERQRGLGLEALKSARPGQPAGEKLAAMLIELGTI